eukprot:TRINITY_DN11102_c0_g1_i1.p1 TRINITY_DN11102_c0_g1~~TRINITY_DN11102_c0_g1_i1.p1  ORF type:complete len:262 (-),score=20.54 TRINITY_DN11102_c0_g1_i1:313-1098(-)
MASSFSFVSLSLYLCISVVRCGPRASMDPTQNVFDVNRCNPMENVFVINVKGKYGEARRQSVRREFRAAGVENYKFWDAVVWPQVLEEGHTKPPSLGKGETALALSHRSIYEHIVQDRLPCALIFEDDVLLTRHFKHRLNKSDFPNHFSVIKLDYCKHVKREQPPVDQDSIPRIYIGQGGACTGGYVVSLLGAAFLKLANTPVWMNADGIMDPVHMQQTQVGPNLKDFLIYHFDPPLAWQGRDNLPGGKETHKFELHATRR